MSTNIKITIGLAIGVVVIFLMSIETDLGGILSEEIPLRKIIFAPIIIGSILVGLFNLIFKH